MVRSAPEQTTLAAVRFTCSFAAAAALCLAATPCRAEGRDPAASLFAGASVLAAGFTVGALLLTTSNASATESNAGWLTIESGIALAPFAAHAVAGEWARGLAFSALPAGAIGGTAALFQYDPGTIAHGSLPEQRWLWSMFSVALAASTAGIVDALLSGPDAPMRARSIVVAPTVASGRVGLVLQGPL
jgi:hypothetical protein